MERDLTSRQTDGTMDPHVATLGLKLLETLHLSVPERRSLPTSSAFYMTRERLNPYSRCSGRRSAPPLNGSIGGEHVILRGRRRPLRTAGKSLMISGSYLRDLFRDS